MQQLNLNAKTHKGDDIMKKKKHAGGRPPKYTEAETMQYKINKYFDSCFTPARDRNGNFLKFCLI